MTLEQRYENLLKQEPGIRIRNAADALGVSELELALLNDRTVRLRTDPASLMNGLTTIGRVMALTRNTYCVHERKGEWTECEISGPPHFPIGLVHNKDIDLRLFLGRWKHIISTEVPSRGRQLKSIQVFDISGTAVHKIYAVDGTNMDAWATLISSMAADEVAPLELSPAPSPAIPSGPTDAEAFLNDWAAMKDTHEFFPLLRKHEVARLRAVELAEGRFTRRLVGATDVQTMLESAAQSGQDIMCFVGNPGLIQIHTGPVKRIMMRGPWINVMDPDFNLHLNGEGIASVWHVSKPTEDGPVNSIEVYDAAGEMIVQFFGARKPGQPEDVAWTDLLSSLSA